LRVAIVHYWLVTTRGGERVLQRILNMFPRADVFTHVYDPNVLRQELAGRKVTTTFIDKLPFSRSKYQSYLPLMPLALEELDFNGYDLIISSEAGPAKGIIPPPTATHVCYCHSPMRYIWDQYHIYKSVAGPITRLAMPVLSHALRQWDMTAAARVDHFAANSRFVAKRIEKYYRRDATVVPPPVDVQAFTAAATRDRSDTFIWVGQLVPYKRPDVAVEAFNQLGLPLTIVGRGSEKARLQKLAKPNIRFIDSLPFDELRQLCGQARALIFTPMEDFGITPVEVIAAGAPVIAFGLGGALETMAEGVTGLFYHEQSAAALVDAVERLNKWMPDFDPAAAQAHAQQFSGERFDENFRRFVDGALS
jgi:glycosyltransferase involved in cell wall biosynthesis